MKKLTFITLLLAFIVVSFFSCCLILNYFDRITQKEYKQLIKIASQTIAINENNEQNKRANIIQETEEKLNNTIGILEIEKINLIAPVQEGTTSEILKYSVGHFAESDEWDGNIALASHNRGSYAKYFKDIDTLTNGDKIIYKTVYGERKYQVYEKEKIQETNWTKIMENKNENTITLITCITNEREYRLCVKAVEV